MPRRRGSQQDVKRLRDERGALEEVEGHLVTRFNGQGGGDQGEDAWVIGEVGSTKVRRDAEVLDNSRASHHGWDIREQGQCVKRASQWRPTQCDEGLRNNGGMGRLVRFDGLDGGQGGVP